MSYAVVDSNASLADAVTAWRRAGKLALDTEFIRTRTFYPIAALYQVASDGNAWIVDPLVVDTWAPFVELLRDPGVVKVMHACGEDLEVFARHLDCAPAGIYDTQVAEGFLSATYSPSYAELVRRHAGREIGKHETRSDWLARPLSAEQLAYAVEDVAYLGRIHDHQRAELERLGRLTWFEAECRERCRLSVVTPPEYYRNVRGASRCDETQLRRLRRVCAWRELRARERDLPRGRVVKDEELLALVVVDRPDRETVFHTIHPGAARRYWHDLLTEIEAADAEPRDIPIAPVPRPLGRPENDAVKALKDVATARAEALGVAPELLGRRRDLEACVRTFADTGELSPVFGQGWRRALLGPDFERVLKSARGVAS